jgi:NTE family protein
VVRGAPNSGRLYRRYQHGRVDWRSLCNGHAARGNQQTELQIDWNEVLGAQARYSDLAYRRKQDFRAYPNSLQFGLRHGLTIPGALNTGQTITFLFDRIALPYSELKSFDDLPIPFRCVGTDLVTGQPHVFKDGPLGQALRSTMSLPAVFTPVKNGASLYADGGLLDNLPVDVVKAIGAGIVIAVNLSTAEFNPNNSQSMFSVMGRSISVMISANELRSMQMADLLISVDLSSYTSMDYEAAQKIIQRGYQAAEQKSQLLSRLALDETAWREYLVHREAKRIHTTPVPQSVDVKGVPPQVAQDIEKNLATFAGKPLDTGRLEQDINVISGSGRFSSFSYAMEQKDDESGLVIQGNEKEYGPPFLNLGIIVDGSDYDNVLFTAQARITAMDVGGFRSEWRTDFSAGSTWGVASEYYKPLSLTTKWFIAPRAYMSNVPLDIYTYSKPVANYRVRQPGGWVRRGLRHRPVQRAPFRVRHW